MALFGSILDVFEDFSILDEKQQLKHRKSNPLINFAFLDTQLDPPTRETSGDISSFTLCFEILQQQRHL